MKDLEISQGNFGANKTLRDTSVKNLGRRVVKLLTMLK
jgi:hypothetical protein